MKEREEETKNHFSQPSPQQTLTKSITMTNLFNKESLHNLTSKGILKQRVLNTRQNQLVSSISASNVLGLSSQHIKTQQNRPDSKANSPFIANKIENDKKQKARQTSIEFKLNELITFIQNASEETVIKCKDIWNWIELNYLPGNCFELLNNEIQTSKVLLSFSIIICYDIACHISDNKGNSEKEYLKQIKGALFLHIKIIELTQFSDGSSIPLEHKDQIKLSNSIKSLVSSIGSIHQTCFKYYLPQKDNDIIFLWRKIPQVSSSQLNDLFNRLPLTKALNRDQTPSAYYLPKEKSKSYTLVLDLDETLIHCINDINDSSKGMIKFRPGLIEFLENVFPYYELVLFTLGLPEYANPIINSIEKTRKYFQHRLFREHTIIYNNLRIKDLRRLGRDMKSIILIDDKEINFSLHKENGILIKPYYAQDANDISLIELIPILICIAREKMDVREGIRVNKALINQNVSCKT